MKKVVLLFGMLFGIIATVSAQVGLQRRTADELLQKGDGYHAMTMYRGLLKDDPNNAELHYNLANSLYQMQLWDEAMGAYRKALSLTSDEKMKQYIQYNISNCLYKKQQLKESIEGYKQALRKNPADQDARMNLEFALRHQAEDQKQQNNQDSSRQQNKSNEKNDQQKQDQQSQSKEQKDRQDPKEDPQNPQKPQDHKMTRREAERLLDALKDKEKEYQKKRLLENLRSENKSTKDW